MQINNWNEQRKAWHLGNMYIASIRGNIIRDIEVLKEHIEVLDLQKQSARRLIEIFESADRPEVDRYQFMSDVQVSSTYIDMQRPRAIMDELLASGQSHLLHDETLISQLHEYYAFYDFSISVYQELPKQTRHQVRYLSGTGATLESMDAWWIDNFENPPTADHITALLNNKELDLAVQRVYISSHIMEGRLNEVIDKAQALISYIEETHSKIIEKYE